jgi:hypothetical protein
MREGLQWKSFFMITPPRENKKDCNEKHGPQGHAHIKKNYIFVPL